MVQTHEHASSKIKGSTGSRIVVYIAVAVTFAVVCLAALHSSGTATHLVQEDSPYRIRKDGIDGVHLVEEATESTKKQMPSEQRTFQYIYDEQMWGSGGNGSGDGSTLSYTTRTRALVEMLVYKYSIKTLVDAPCGGMTWMPQVVLRLFDAMEAFHYVGLDIVPSVIEANRRTFSRYPRMSFDVVDFSKIPIRFLGRESVREKGPSAIFSRDALQHLPLNTVVDALESFSQSEVEYIIVGSYHTVGENKNVHVGGYFNINLSKKPFHLLPAPLDVVEEETPDGKHMVVYKREDLEKVDFDAMRRIVQSEFKEQS